MDFTHHEIAARLFNRPAAITESKARVLLSVVAPRLGIGSLRVAWADRIEEMAAGDMADIAADARADIGGPRRRGDRAPYEVVEGVAIIPVIGTLVHKLGGIDPFSGMTGYNGITFKLREAMADATVRAIAFDIDSPGGEVSGLYDLGEEIFAARGDKPIWAIATEEAYSAAYWIASAADRVILPRTGGLGSIGVIAMHADYSRMLDESGITVTAIYAGAHKNDGTPYEELSDQARARVQADVDDTYTLFTDTVARNRGLSVDAVRDTEALTFTGPAAVAAGLGDAVASPIEAFQALLAELDGISPPGAARAQTKESAVKRSLLGLGGRKRAAEDEDREENPEAMEDEEEEKASTGSDSAAEDHDEDEDMAEGEGDEKEASAFARGKAAGRKAERKAAKARFADILNSTEAKGREGLAQSLALDTDIPAAQAIKVLESSARESGGLAATMAGVPNPDVGPDGGGSGVKTPGQGLVDACRARGEQLAARRN